MHSEFWQHILHTLPHTHHLHNAPTLCPTVNRQTTSSSRQCLIYSPYFLQALHTHARRTKVFHSVSVNSTGLLRLFHAALRCSLRPGAGQPGPHHCTCPLVDTSCPFTVGVLKAASNIAVYFVDVFLLQRAEL